MKKSEFGIEKNFKSVGRGLEVDDDGDSALKFSVRDFDANQDVPRVKAFLLGREKWKSLPDYWTFGKSTVGTFQTILDSPASHHKFWRDARGEYYAYLWLHPEPSETIVGNSNSWRVLVHPQGWSREFMSSVIPYAEDQLLQLTEPLSQSEQIETVCYGEDRCLASLLLEHGYTKREALEVYMQRNLGDPIDEPDLVDGYTIRPLDAEGDVLQRAGAQSDAFAGQPEPDAWAIANIERFLRWYEGKEDLDLVAVSTAGEIASFAAILIDPVTQVGEVDPVGTRESHQRKGLSKALLLSGIQYMKSKKMEFACVRTGVENDPAIRTYQSVGFHIVDNLYRYTKDRSLSFQNYQK